MLHLWQRCLLIIIPHGSLITLLCNSFNKSISLMCSLRNYQSQKLTNRLPKKSWGYLKLLSQVSFFIPLTSEFCIWNSWWSGLVLVGFGGFWLVFLSFFFCLCIILHIFYGRKSVKLKSMERLLNISTWTSSWNN